MKRNRFLSLLCAIAMSLSLVLSAGAASVSEIHQLSPYAGKTVSVQISVVDSSDKVSTTTIPVSIPARATMAEASTLVKTVASQTKQVRAISASPAIEGIGEIETISTQGLTLVYDNKYATIGEGSLSRDYETLLVEIIGVYTTSAKNILLRVNTTGDPTVGYDKTGKIPYTGADIILVYLASKEDYLPMKKNDTITVYAKVDKGSANFNKINVYADTAPYG